MISIWSKSSTLILTILTKFKSNVDVRVKWTSQHQLVITSAIVFKIVYIIYILFLLNIIS